MKRFLLLILILNVSVVYGQKRKKEVIEVTFQDGFETNVIVHDKNPYSIQEDHIKFHIINLKLSQDKYNDSNATGGGPIALDVDYRKYFNKLDYMLGGIITYFPLDISNKISEKKREFQKINLSGEIYGHYSFYQNQKIKKTHLNFERKKNGRSIGDNTTYYFKYLTPYLRTFNIRSGINYSQHGMNQGISSEYEIESGRNIAFFLGLSTNKMMYMKYESEDFGKAQESFINSIYIDFFYRPLSRLYGISTNDSSPFIKKNGFIDDDRLYQDNWGFRLGFTSEKKYISSFEFGVLPLYNSIFYLQMKFGPVLKRN